MQRFSIFSLLVALAIQCEQLPAQEIHHNPATNTFSVVGLDDPERPAGAKNRPYWKYFWEFGDGHYDMAESPSYCYGAAGTYQVRVSLTPYYSYESTRTIVREVTVSRACSETPSYEEQTGYIDVVSNANGELVPGNQFELAVHVRMPPGVTASTGYVVLCYNSIVQQRNLKLRFQPLAFRPGEERLYSAEPLAAVIPTQLSGISESARSYVSQLINEYQVKGYVCEVSPGQETRLFATLGASSALDTTIIKGKKGALNIVIKAVWIPKGVAFDAGTMVDNYPMQLLSVHDPNKLRIARPAGAAFYNRRYPQWLEYEIHYQNKGGRPVKQLDIEVPWDRNLDYRTIEVLTRDPDIESCPVCPPDVDPRSMISSCFAVDTSAVSTSGLVTFSFYNVMIHGKNEGGVGGGKYTRGFVRYRVKSNHERIDHQRSVARIIFEGGEPLLTSPDRKKWRHKYFGIKGGRNFSAQLDGFESVDDEVGRWYNAAFMYKNTPVYHGLGYGFELGSAGFGFRVWSVDFAPQMETFELSDEIIDIRTLDLQLQGEVRLAGAVSAGIGAGLTVPLKGEGQLLSGRPFSDELQQIDWDLAQEPDRITQADLDRMKTYNGEYLEATSGFGLFDAKEQVQFGDLDINSKTSLGTIVSGQIEAGFLNGIAAGGRYVLRIYPDAYKEQCMKLRNAELYLRIKLGSGR
ncbi:MAG: PKD domain-containing protein [Saprospiraceae bacterium]|nr:PKD domain-containing protein [Saprospiraceae bacterium]